MNSPQFKEALEKLRQAPRKAEVLRLMLAGHTNAEIARLRGRAEGTVRKQISNIYQDFGIESEFPGDQALRDKLKALFGKYKPDWITNCSSVVVNESSNQGELVNQNGVPYLVPSNDELFEEVGEDLLFLAINMLQQLGFNQKFKMIKASEYVGYRFKYPGEGDKRYQLFLNQRKYGLCVSITKYILEPYLLNLEYWVDIGENLGRMIAGRFLIIPGRESLFLDSLNPKYWNLLEVEGKTVGTFYLNERENPEVYNPMTDEVTQSCLDGFSRYSLSDWESYLVIREDEKFTYTWQVFIDSKQVLQEFIGYFGNILMNQEYCEVLYKIDCGEDIPF
jgi:hypothetical protein